MHVISLVPKTQIHTLGPYQHPHPYQNYSSTLYVLSFKTIIFTSFFLFLHENVLHLVSMILITWEILFSYRLHQARVNEQFAFYNLLIYILNPISLQILNASIVLSVFFS